MKHIFIINPASGKGKALGYKEEIEKVFAKRDDEFEIIETEFIGHAIDITRQYAENDNVRLYSIGGDGTLNEVLNGAYDYEIPVGVIPAGSGNDFVRTVYPKMNLSREEQILSLVDGEIEPITVGRVNDARFANISSIGFDAYVTEQARALKKIPWLSGNFAYMFAIILALTTFKRKKFKVTLDDEVLEKEVFLTAFGVGKYYGGGMKVLPNADSSEDVIDVCIVHSISKLMVLFLFPKLIKGEHLSKNLEKYIMYKKVKKLSFIGDTTITLNRDGELYPSGEEIHCCISSKKMNLIKPKLKRAE